MMLKKTNEGFIVYADQEVKCKYCSEIIKEVSYVCIKHRTFYCEDCATNPKIAMRCFKENYFGFFVNKIPDGADCFFKRINSVIIQ